MKNLTSLIKTMRRLRNWLAVALWLGIVWQNQAGTVSVTTFSPQAVTPEYASVSVTVALTGVVLLDGDIPETLSITTSGGDFGYGGDYPDQLVYMDWSPTYNFWVTQITDDLDITFQLDGSTPVTVHIPCARISSLEARMAQVDTAPPITDAANYDQDIFFKAITDPSTLPTGLTHSDISWNGVQPISGTPWASLTDHVPGHPQITAQLGSVGVTMSVWCVRLTLKEITLGGTGFREIKMDPPSTSTYSAPHWDSSRSGNEAYPVLMQINQKFTATPKFMIEPADWPGTATIGATGDYDMGEGSSSSGQTTIVGPTLTADLEVDISVGEEKPSLNWTYRIQESVDTDAGTSDLDIYRAVDASATDYITVVDIACKGGGVDAASITSAIWGPFSMRTVEKYKTGFNMTYYYWGNDSPDNRDKTLLIGGADGRCGGWADLFKSALSIHGIIALVDSLTVTPQLIVNYEVPGVGWVENRRLSAKGIVARPSLRGQGETSNPLLGFSDGHDGVRIPTLGAYGKVYDPSYGEGPFTSKLLWEEAVLERHVFEDPGHQDPYQPVPDQFWLPNFPGVMDTCRSSISLNAVSPPAP